MTDPHHRRILIVDDDLDTRDLYRMVLESVGYQVDDAATVRGALAGVRRMVPDVVMTDWLLPDGDGLLISHTLRESRVTRRVPVVAVTGLSLDEAALRRARDAGIFTVLGKPADPDEILAGIRGALTSATGRRLCDAAARTRRYARKVRRALAPSEEATEVAFDARALLQRAASRSDGSITLVIADDTGHYVAAGGATRELTGYDDIELAGLSVWDLTSVPNTVDGHGLWEQFIAAGAQQGHYVLRRRDGKAIDAQYCAVANIAPGWHVSAIAELPDLPVSLGDF